MKLSSRVLRGALVVSLLGAVAAPVLAVPAQAAAPTGITTLLSPGEGATVGGDVTFSWSAVPGAAKYRVQVSRSELFDSLVYNVDTVNLHATPPAALPAEQLFWRVAPTDGASGVGTFTQGSFTRVWAAAPEVMSPADGATLTYPNDPLLFTWQPLAGAQKYNIQVDDDVNFVGAPTYMTNNTSYTLTDPQTNDQLFFWRVQGISGTVVSPWSEARSYTVQWPQTPVLVSPHVGQSITDVVLEWTPVTGATTYELEVSPNPDFTNNISIDVIVKGTRYSPPDTLDNGSYYWRVRTRDGKSTSPNFGAWSSRINGVAAQFTRAWDQRPTLLAPADKDYGVVSPTLRWTAVPYASHYQLDVSMDPNFTTYWSCTTNQTSYTPYYIPVGSTVGPVPTGKCDVQAQTMPVGPTLYWRVRGMDGPGPGNDAIWGLYSDPFSFAFTNNGAPVMTGPSDGQVVSTPQLSWNPVLGVARYKVSIQKAGSHITGSPFTTYAASITPDKLAAGETYTWWVQTLDDNDRPGLMPIASRSFTVQPVEGGSVLELLGPAAGSYELMPAMSWKPVLGATKYKVYRGTPGSPSSTFLGETNATSYTHKDAPLGGAYEWFVIALNAGGSIIAESVSSTFSITDLPVITGLTPAKCVDTTCAPTPETPRLTWTPQAFAGGYIVTIANDKNFTNVVRTYVTQHSSLTPRESLRDSTAGEAYYWFVRPCRSAMDLIACGKYDLTVFPTAGAFRKRSLPVELLSPANGATVPAEGSADHQNITFTWKEFAGTNAAADPPASQGAKKYRVLVYTTADHSALPIDTADVDQTTYTPHSKTYPEGPLYWEVLALDGSNNELTRSERRLVTKATPKIVPQYPVPDATVATTPHFKWGAQPHVKSYELEVYKNGDALFSLSNRVNLGSSPQLTRLTAFTPTLSLPAGAYAWRVRRIDVDNRPGPWSSGGLFTIASGAPTLLAPASGTVFTSNDMLFTWSPVPGAAKYRFESSDTAGFARLIDSTSGVTTVMPAWAPTVKYPDGTIYWRVKVLDAADNVTGVSTTWSIKRDLTVPTVVSKTPTANAPITGGAFTVTFSEPVVGISPATFSMKVASTGNVVQGTTTPGVSTATTTATFKPSFTLTPGETYTLSIGDGVTDTNGNRLTPASWSVRTALTVDALSPAVQQYWDRDTSTAASGGGYLASRTPGASVKYTFTGTSASILGRRHVDGGYAYVYLDGVKQPTVSFYASTTRWQQVVWSKSGLADTSHTVELRVVGTKPSASKGTWVYPDAFRYGVTTMEETNGTVLRQAHRNVNLSGAYGGSYVLATHTASGDNAAKPYVTMKFKGTGISWAGFRGTAGGYARVYVDNVAKGVVDTYGSPTSQAGQLWRITGLPNGTHTLKVELLGTRRTGSAGYDVTFDSFTVV